MKDIIVYHKPKSPISEAYRAIRTNIMFANVDKSFKSIMVTSATKDEGKTQTLCNVALTFAMAGSKVIILDTDLRKPKVHKVMEVSNQSGVTDLLMKGGDYHSYVNKDIYPNLHLISAGKIPGNPSEILTSNAMKVLVEKLKEDYDYIFIDTPPIMPVNDAVIMATYIDRVMIVCASGQVEIEMATKAKRNLENVGAKILGVVLNKVPVEMKRYNYYYYYDPKAQKHTD